MCIYDCCKKTPFYNNYGESKAIYCSIHKLEGMVNIASKKCIHDGCRVQPSYNNIGEKKLCIVYNID